MLSRCQNIDREWWVLVDYSCCDDWMWFLFEVASLLMLSPACPCVKIITRVFPVMSRYLSQSGVVLLSHRYTGATLVTTNIIWSQVTRLKQVSRLKQPYQVVQPYALQATPPCSSLVGDQGLPFGHQGLPFGHQGVPVGHQGLLFDHQGLPFGHQASLQSSVTKVFPLVTKIFPSLRESIFRQRLLGPHTGKIADSTTLLQLECKYIKTISRWNRVGLPFWYF